MAPEPIQGPPRRPLRDVLTNPDAPEQLQWLQGIVTARQVTTAPYTVTVRLPDGSTVGPLPYLGWYDPRVNDVVHMLKQGPALLVLGTTGPANLYVPPAPVVPPAPPAPPPAPPTQRTVPVSPIDQAYWSQWGWKTDDLVQGGPANRAFWFYGGGIAAAKGSGTIIGGSIYIARRDSNHGVNGAANVRLGTHGYGTRPGSGAAGHGAVSVPRQLQRGEGATVPLSADHVAQLNAGAAGLGLEPGGSSYTSPDYLRAVYGGASGQLSLTILG